MSAINNQRAALAPESRELTETIKITQTIRAQTRVIKLLLRLLPFVFTSGVFIGFPLGIYWASLNPQPEPQQQAL